MVSSQATRKVQKQLKDAGFVAGRKEGSHTWWSHSSGAGVSLPDGHNEISPGVYRQVLKAIEKAKAAK
jgi:predicted RNA binding protein YcfA (HicA-like mRNA interferase family)